MKKPMLLFMILAIAASLFATGMVVETEDVIEEITILTGGTYETSLVKKYAVDKFNEDYPEVTVRFLALDLSTGSTMSMTALQEANIPPNVYEDWNGRIAGFSIPGYALPLDDAVRGLDQFYDGVLDPYRTDGVLYAVPSPSQSNGMVINLDIMDEIGYTVPDNWTVLDFLEMCELVKRFYGGEKWGTFMYAKTMSGDYQINNWFGTFGAEFFAPGDYTRSTIRETGGAKVHAFFQTLMRNGYIPPDAATLGDGKSFNMWGDGVFAAAPFFPGWVYSYQDAGVSRGNERFRLEFVEMPTATGDPVPTYSTGVSYMVVETGTAADAMAARLIEYLTDAGSHAIITETSGIPSNRKDFIIASTDILQAQTGAITATNGTQDVGVFSPVYPAIRAQHTPILRRLLNFELTPEESILLYEEAVNEVLAY